MALNNPILKAPFRSLILGSSGAIGAAFYELVHTKNGSQNSVGLHRKSEIILDYQNPDSIAHCVDALSKEKPFHLIINTIGTLHSERWMPEKKLADINFEQLRDNFQINTIGPALTIRDFSKLLDPNGAIFATISAKVGSISDNRLGGWYSYRASKAALNMLIKTASIELARTQPNTAIVAIHPGTVKSSLSKPFRGMEIGRPPLQAAQEMLDVLEKLTTEDSGKFLSYSGELLPW